MSNWSEPLFPVTFIPTDGSHEWQIDTAWIPPVIGAGIIDEGGRRYRIVDVWMNFEKHGGGIGEYGIYAYVERAVGESDRPGRLHDYYTS